MTIEFSCPHCKQLLRTADDKAGLSAKCPACGEVLWVPLSADAVSADREAAPLAGEGRRFPDGAGPSEPIVENEPVRLVRCPGCSAENGATASRCRYCGSSLEGAEPVEERRETVLPPFDVGEVMSTAWRLFTKEVGLLLAAAVLTLIIFLAAFFLVVVPMAVAAVALEDKALLVVVPLAFLFVPLLVVVGSALTVGNLWLCRRIARGPEAGIADLFYGFGEGRDLLLSTWLLLVICNVLTFVGMIFFCIPGVLVMLCCWPAFPLLVERRCSSIEAIQQTYELAKKQLWSILGVGAIAFGVVFVTSMIPYIGLILHFFALPFAVLLVEVGYLRISGEPTVFDH